jgi:hypothetical protein
MHQPIFKQQQVHWVVSACVAGRKVAGSLLLMVMTLPSTQNPVGFISGLSVQQIIVCRPTYPTAAIPQVAASGGRKAPSLFS